MEEAARHPAVKVFVSDAARGTAVERFLERYRDSSFRIAMRILGDREQAEDVCQEALIRAFKSWDQLARADFQSAWVRKTVVRCSLTALSRRQATAPLDETAGPDQTANRVEVRDVLRSLSIEHQAVLALSLGEGWSYAEIAEILDVPEGTVASRLHAAKAAFKVAWEEDR